MLNDKAELTCYRFTDSLPEIHGNTRCTHLCKSHIVIQFEELLHKINCRGKKGNKSAV